MLAAKPIAKPFFNFCALQNAYLCDMQGKCMRCLFTGIALQEVTGKVVRNFRLLFRPNFC